MGQFFGIQAQKSFDTSRMVLSGFTIGLYTHPVSHTHPSRPATPTLSSMSPLPSTISALASHPPFTHTYPSARTHTHLVEYFAPPQHHLGLGFHPTRHPHPPIRPHPHPPCLVCRPCPAPSRPWPS